ncbi:MAG TPA: flavodoxin domain-containing protein, partial [Trebonia sp.]|nr:flavodoxin domain-containing protein [Trebonia sp.]
MRALVVYESMYGNTHAVADSIAAGLRATHEVTVVPVSQATRELVADAGLIVAGGPTHLHRLSTASSRRAALTAARAENSGLTIDPAAEGPGLRAWLADLGSLDILAASYDTRLGASPLFTGRASRAIARMLTRHGGRLVVPPE